MVEKVQLSRMMLLSQLDMFGYWYLCIFEVDISDAKSLFQLTFLKSLILQCALFVPMRMMVDLGRASRQETTQMRKVIFARQPYDGLD